LDAGPKICREESDNLTKEETHGSSACVRVETSGREGGFDQRPKALKLNCTPASVIGRTTSRKIRGLFRRREGLRTGQEAANDRRAGSPRRDKTGRRRLAREKLRRVLAPTGTAETREPAREPRQKPETRRTPGSAAGCNKPAKLRAEQAIKAVRNREGGTRPAKWQRQADVWKQKRKATFSKQKHRSGRKEPESMEGRSLETPRELI